MNCVVCGKPLTDETRPCPRCGFPNVYFPGNYQEGLKAIQSEIDAHRTEFLKKIQVGVVIYRWKAGTDQVELDQTEVLPIADCSRLSSGTVWLSQQFARIPNEQIITLQLQIKGPQSNRDTDVEIANPQTAYLQQVGLSMDDELNLIVHLRNAAGEQTQSQRFPLFL